MDNQGEVTVRAAWPQMVRYLAGILASMAILFTCATAGAQEDSTGSPYFLVTGDEDTADRFPLVSTSVNADIGGVIADVTVLQVYENSGTVPIEAVYVFPASTRAAVHGMRVRIDDRVLVAEIREREQARAEYEEARDAGQGAALLEQERENVFMMSVANIMPGDVVEVELSYTELLTSDAGEYTFMYPTVVGPRYGEEDFNANPYLGEGEDAPYGFDITVTLSTGMDLASLATPGHDTVTEQLSAGSVRVGLAEGETAGNRDFLLTYRPGGAELSSGLLLQPDSDGAGGWFLLTAQPPAREHIISLPSEYIFIVDVSGSMNGFPLDTARTLLDELLSNLTPGDTFNILLFSGSSQLFAPESVGMTAANVEEARRFLQGASGAGGTELLGALQHALSLPRADGSATSIVVITDGYVTVEREAMELIRSSLGQANLFAFGIGSSVNHFLIEGLARAGSGEPFTVLSGAEAPGVADRLRSYISSPVLTDIEVHFDGFDVRSVEPVSYPDLMAERPVIVYGRFEGEAAGSITVSGRTATGMHSESFDIAADGVPVQGSPLSYLWARESIARLSDLQWSSDGADVKREITELGLQFSLMTEFTSFVAIDSVDRNDGTFEEIRQPLPLPQGVPGSAVGRAGAMPFAASVMPSPTVAQDVVTAETEPSPVMAAMLNITSLQVTGMLSESDARAVLEDAIDDLLVCLAPGEAVRAQLIPEASGITLVVNVSPIAGNPDQMAQVCTAVVLEGLEFGVPGTIIVDLSAY